MCHPFPRHVKPPGDLLKHTYRTSGGNVNGIYNCDIIEREKNSSDSKKQLGNATSSQTRKKPNKKANVTLSDTIRIVSN